MSVSPTATRNSSIPMMKPLVLCVTRQAEEARQPVSASRSKGTCPSRLAGVSVKNQGVADADTRCPLPADSLGVAFALLPLGLKRQNLLPVAALDLGNIRFAGNGGAPANRVADQGLVFRTHRHSPIGAEWRFDRQTTHGVRDLLAISRIRLLRS